MEEEEEGTPVPPQQSPAVLQCRIDLRRGRRGRTTSESDEVTAGGFEPRSKMRGFRGWGSYMGGGGGDGLDV